MRRKKIRLRYKMERVVFSDVLPYELPLIFSNRYFYRFLVHNGIKIDIGTDTKGGDTVLWQKNAHEAVLAILAILFNKDIKFFKDKSNLKLNSSDLKRIPFVYSIRHKETKHRYLSLVHPANQIKVVDFYRKYKDAIIYLCSKSNFSMRFPNKVACYFYYKDRLHHVLLGRKTDRMEMYFSEYENLKTFFSYKKYTNIYKFYEDYRYQRAEKKFCHLLKMDVQSCFDSIYTHSIAWAVSGGADIYKDTFGGKYDGSIGAVWDNMMQEMNYNETNGIVIGPEFSRLFAEVILQHIDQRVEHELLQLGYRNKVHYECYRYVDDYFFFYNDDKVKEKAEELFQHYLKEFKLSISHEKTKVIDRPFVTEITKAKIEIDTLLDENIKLHSEEAVIEPYPEEEVEEAEQDLADDIEPVYVKVDRKKAEESLNAKLFFRMKATDFNKRFKTIVDSNQVEYKDVLNYTIARIAIRIERALKKLDKTYKILCLALEDEELKDLHKEVEIQRAKLEKSLALFLFQVLDSVFFLYSNSKRINTTLKVIQVLNTIRIYLDNHYTLESKADKPKLRRFTEYAREMTFKKIRDEISLVFQTSPVEENVQLETLYFLVFLRSMNSKYYLSSEELEKYLRVKHNEDGSLKEFPNYNALAKTILFYYFGHARQYQPLKDLLIKQTLVEMDGIPEARRKISSEYIIFSLDMAACPYILPSCRHKLLQKVGASRATAEMITNYMSKQKFMFTKWTGVDITKELNAKISQEVYS